MPIVVLMMLHHDKDSDGASDDISHGVVVGDDLDTVVNNNDSYDADEVRVGYDVWNHDMSILTALRFVYVK